MPENERHVEISLNLDASGLEQGLDQASRKIDQFQQQTTGSFDPSVALGAAGFSQSPPPPSSSSPAIPGGGFSASGGSLFLPPQTDPGVAVGAAGMPQMPAPMGGAPAPGTGGGGGWEQFEGLEDRLKKAWSDGAAQTPPNPNDETKEERSGLVDALRGLRGTVQEDGKKRKDHLTEIFQFDAMMRLGRQVGQDVSQGRMFSAVGGGVGGALGLFGGPVGRLVGGGISAAGGLLDQLMGGTGGARNFEKEITDMNQRFGLGDVGRLRNYRLGEQYGYTGVESAGMIDRLRENRALDNPAQAGPLVNAIQEMTRALGLNAEATIEMVGVYSRTGGEKGAQGARGYLADVVGGAIRAGFESNVQQYADMMGSARMQAVQTTGQGVSDRAFNLLQDVMGGLTGGDSRTSSLFRDNSQMAAMGMQSFLAMGGTANPYSTSAAYMRLAGINEANLDTRFNTAEQIAQNAQQSLGWTTGRLQEMSGMSAAQFQQNAQNSPNFIQDLLSNSVVMQRQTSHIVSGFLGREATANDLRAYEELTNIAAANGGQLPMEGNSPDASRVDELLKQLQASPADEMRQKEAARHNAVMEAMANFMNLQTKVDTWMISIAEWFSGMNLKNVEKVILDAMGGIETAAIWMKDRLPEIRIKILEVTDTIVKWAEENNIVPLIGEWMERIFERIGLTLNALANPGKVAEGAAYTVGQGANAVTSTLLPMLGAVNPALQPLTILDNATDGGVQGALQGGRRAVGGGVTGLARRAASAVGGFLHDQFNDTPGTVTATPGYNTFRFAPGDVISARQGSVPGGATLTDINLTLNQGMNLGVQQHRETLETAGLLQDVTNKIHELFGKTQADVENYVAKLFPALMEGQTTHIDLTAAGNAILESIEKAIPGVVAAIDAVKEAISSMALASAAGLAGGAGGTGQLGAFASGLFTGPRANIGGSSPNHIDTKISSSLSWEEIDAYFMQMAQAYESQNRRIEFSNSAVSGQVYDPNADQADRIALLQRAAAAHSHSRTQGFHSFDYYVPLNGDARSESANSSSAGVEMMLPTVSGGRVEYGSGGRYGNFANIYDADGRMIIRTGHGDNRRALPQGRDFPTAPPPGAGGAAQAGNYAPNVSQEFLNATDAMAQRLGVRPEYLIAAMGFETGGTFSPSIRNAAGSGATGLIQFMPDTAEGLGTSTGALSRMSATQQLRYVEQYMGRYRGQLNSLEDVYMSILYPAAIGRGPEHTLFRQGTTAYRQNQGLDVNRDGRVTVGEATEKVRAYMPNAEVLQRLPSYRERASNVSNSITVNVASANNRAEAEAGVRAAIPALTASLDEFEQRRQGQANSNPRNRTGDRTLSPVYS